MPTFEGWAIAFKSGRNRIPAEGKLCQFQEIDRSDGAVGELPSAQLLNGHCSRDFGCLGVWNGRGEEFRLSNGTGSNCKTEGRSLLGLGNCLCALFDGFRIRISESPIQRALERKRLCGCRREVFGSCANTAEIGTTEGNLLG